MQRAKERGAVQHWIVPYPDGDQLSAGVALCHSDDQRAIWLSVWSLQQQRGHTSVSHVSDT